VAGAGDKGRGRERRQRRGQVDPKRRGLGRTEVTVDRGGQPDGQAGMARTPAGARRPGKMLEAERDHELERHPTARRGAGRSGDGDRATARPDRRARFTVG